MRKCDSCGNMYHSSFVVIMNGEHYVFDCFECAINRLAPRCAHCETRVIGHGVESKRRIFCCAHCAKQEGIRDLRDQSRAHA